VNNKVFISYAKEDFRFAQHLSENLKLNNYAPWLDKEKILAGQNWDIEIKKALRQSDFIILLLSQNSVNKKGYVQREFKLALNYCDERPVEDIFLIPVKINDCSVPFGLEKYQWFELNGRLDFDGIADSLNHQKKKLDAINTKDTPVGQFKYTTKIINKEIGINPKSIIDIFYPSFLESENEDFSFINNKIENYVFAQYERVINPRFTDLEMKPQDNDDIFAQMDNELKVSFDIKTATNNIVSLTIRTYMFLGGAHGNYWTVGFNFRLNPFLTITLSDIFPHGNDINLTFLINTLKVNLMLNAKEKFGIIDPDEFFLLPLKREWSEISNFVIEATGITFIFGIYQLTAYSLGEHEITITFEKLHELFPNLDSLIFIRNNI
jgi:TIR domain/Deacetylase PdaC/Protein of unknown function (DUF3298)